MAETTVVDYLMFNTDASLPYNHDLFESLIVKKKNKDGTTRLHGDTDRILSGRPHLDRRTIRVLNQSLWLKSLTARQRCLAGNANALLFLRNNSPHVPTPNLEDQETVFVRPLAIDQLGMRDSVSVAGTLPRIVQWVAEVRKPPHHGKVQSLRDGLMNTYKHVQHVISITLQGVMDVCTTARQEKTWVKKASNAEWNSLSKTLDRRKLEMC
ncbi:hypothetical protein CSKR_111430 [Clonorchis sinensis]|uniref:Uncharacterized protein n=1 Tax=Clonorchis sinensis TaxID=79923 RepID=A0A419PRP6_CLOSI|nr:hypothetical protein CSKR_111430 [Clonorchis sinensis]